MSLLQGSQAEQQADIEKITPDKSLPERVYESIEQSIVDGVLTPGTHLIEEDLARRLGVSRNPVRQALLRLAQEGFVQHQRGRGAFVHSPSVQEIDDIFHVRTLLESDCARLAAARISEDGLEELRRLLEVGREAVAEEDTRQLLELNDRFHGVIIAAANNPIMERLMVGLRRRIRWYFSSVVVRRAPSSWQEHEGIYEALCARDGERSAALMAEHVGQTSAKIQREQIPHSVLSLDRERTP
ncbi:GntR family transcriptional regulator [Leucobacter sp. GX24907]